MTYSYLTSLSDYGDIHYQGFTTTGASPDGKPFVLKQADAINNAIKMLLLSQKGDYGRDFNRGGPLFSVLNRSAGPGVDREIKDVVIRALSDYTNITVQDVAVVRDDRGEKWKITIYYADLYSKLISSTSIALVEKA